MSRKTHAKICGLTEPITLKAAVDAGARFIGFNFVPQSPRYVAIDIAKDLASQLPTSVRGVGLFVNPTDAELDAVLSRVQLDMIQLHGDETVARVQELKARTMMPIIKAFSVRTSADIDAAIAYDGIADWLLFDAKPQHGLRGGTGEVFDWTTLDGRMFTSSWMLSGGLHSDNVAQALATLSPDAVDVSSGVERMRGEKDVQRIAAFMDAVRLADAS